MLTICIHTKFHLPASSGPLVIAIRLKAKDHFLTADMLFYIFQENYPNESFVFFLKSVTMH
jgi:hypothetical protein